MPRCGKLTDSNIKGRLKTYSQFQTTFIEESVWYI